jgi:hypothetical protein
MYKCGWNGCEKAYGTLNHLNAHVTMQSHGQKRTPEGMFIHTFLEFFLHYAIVDTCATGLRMLDASIIVARNKWCFFVAEFVYVFI